MKKAWIENGIIRDIAYGTPEDSYHPDVAIFYVVDVPDDAESGDSWIDGVLAKPSPSPSPIIWTEFDFRKGMTLAEKTKWDNDTAPEIVTAKAELPKELVGATELLDFLVSSRVISQATANKILA